MEGRLVEQPGKNAHVYKSVKQSGIAVFLDTFFFEPKIPNKSQWQTEWLK